MRLETASSTGDLPTVAGLPHEETDPNASRPEGLPPSTVAAGPGQPKLVKVLLTSAAASVEATADR